MILIMMGYGERLSSPCRQQSCLALRTISRALTLCPSLCSLRAIKTVLMGFVCMVMQRRRQRSDAKRCVSVDLYYGRDTTHTINKGLTDDIRHYIVITN